MTARTYAGPESFEVQADSDGIYLVCGFSDCDWETPVAQGIAIGELLDDAADHSRDVHGEYTEE